jgi:hypothetical protein
MRQPPPWPEKFPQMRPPECNVSVHSHRYNTNVCARHVTLRAGRLASCSTTERYSHMSQRRILRTVPAALLMTTALAWNLPAGAQGTTGSSAHPPAGSAQRLPPAAPPRTPADGAGSTPPPASFGGAPALPSDLRPALPASAASAAAPRGGLPKAPATKP